MSRASDLAERLQGTTDEVMTDETEDFSSVEWNEFYSLVFQCRCGWWCEIGEMQGDGESCLDCLDEEEGEEGA